MKTSTKRIEQLNHAHGLSGGGYSFEVPEGDHESLPGLIWDDPDFDTVPWANDGSFGVYDGPTIYVFQPMCGYSNAVVWPAEYDAQSGGTWQRKANGMICPTERDCDCYGRPDGGGNWEYTGNYCDLPDPSCSHCDGGGHIPVDGGAWAIYQWAEPKPEPTFVVEYESEDSGPHSERIPGYCDPGVRICNEDSEDARGETEGPLDWFHSAGVFTSSEEDRVQFAISLADPRGAFVVTIRRLPDGRLIMHVPHEDMPSPHMPLSELHPGTFEIGGAK